MSKRNTCGTVEHGMQRKNMKWLTRNYSPGKMDMLPKLENVYKLQPLSGMPLVLSSSTKHGRKPVEGLPQLDVCTRTAKREAYICAHARTHTQKHRKRDEPSTFRGEWLLPLSRHKLLVKLHKWVHWGVCVCACMYVKEREQVNMVTSVTWQGDDFLAHWPNVCIWKSGYEELFA